MLLENSKQILIEERKLKRLENVLWYWLFRKTISRKNENLIVLKSKASELQEQYEDAFIDVDSVLEDGIEKKNEGLNQTFNELLKTIKIWDIIAKVANTENKSSANNTITRVPITIKKSNIGIIHSTMEALLFHNANGGDLYIYPSFLIIKKKEDDIAVIDLKDLNVGFKEQSFLEEETIPSDTVQIGTTWAKVNKDGSPDKRFKGNYQIPVVKYGWLLFQTDSGLNEQYHFSNFELSQRFALSLLEYLEEFKKVSVAPPTFIEPGKVG